MDTRPPGLLVNNMYKWQSNSKELFSSHLCLEYVELQGEDIGPFDTRCITRGVRVKDRHIACATLSDDA